METTETLPVTRRKKFWFGCCASALMLLIALAGGEAVVRLLGFKPFNPTPAKILVEPGGKFFALKPAGGYTQLPGKFKVTLATGYSFTVTHDTNALRITHPPVPSGEPRKKEMWLMGCSLTHGWSLNDEETYPWLVQEEFPQYEVVNCGIEGYGTLQTRLQFQELLEQRAKPEIVVLAYGTFQDFRNTFIRIRQKAIAPLNQLGPMQQPYARFNSKGGVDYFMAPVVYREWPLMRHSALVNFVEDRYDAWEARRARSEWISAELILRLAHYCREQGIEFVLAGISSDSGGMLEFCQQRGVKAVNISVVLAEPGNTNLPHDNHPSAKANKVYAQRLANFLRAEVARSPYENGDQTGASVARLQH